MFSRGNYFTAIRKYVLEYVRNRYMPVAGMRGDPGDRSQGGNWARGSFGYQKPQSKGGHIHEGTDIISPQEALIAERCHPHADLLLRDAFRVIRYSTV